MARYPGAIWRPTDKQGYGSDNAHLNLGLIIHSAEGSLAAMFGVLDNPNRQASWTFSIAKNGQAYQHVDTANIAWTNGSYTSNRRFWGIECEGVAGEPLTIAQNNTLIAIMIWLWQTHGVQGGFVRQSTLWEHNEMTQFGSLPTACPSGRVNWPTLIAGAQAGAGGFLMALSDAEQTEVLQRLRNLDALDDTTRVVIDEIVSRIRDVDSRDNSLLVRTPSTGYIYEVVDGQLIHGSNPLVAERKWGPNWLNFVITLDRNNPDHAELLRYEAVYPDGIPAELGGF